jgi:hypothetical protein
LQKHPTPRALSQTCLQQHYTALSQAPLSPFDLDPVAITASF